MNPTSVIAPYSAVAAGSRSGLTKLGMAASDAGLNKPVPTPATSARATVAGNPSTSPMPRNAAPRNTSEMIRQLRLDQRSAAAPRIGPNRPAGTRSATKIKLIAQAEWNRS